MGYESRLYVVNKLSHTKDENGKYYAEKIARFDLCKLPALADYFRNAPKTQYFIYEEDNEILEDNYGEELTELSPQKVIDILQGYIINGGDYWRVYPLLSYLQTLILALKLKGDSCIAVLHYGY